MARVSAIRSAKTVQRVLWGAAALIAIVVTLAVLASVLLRGPMGANLARDLLNGRDLAGWGELELGSVTGNVLGEFRVESLSVSDADGVWIEARDITVRWSPIALISRHVDLEQVSVNQVSVFRRPSRAQSETSPDRSAPWTFSLGGATLREIEMSEAVAGLAAVLSADMSASTRADGLALEFNAQRLDAPGDAVSVQAVLSERIEVQAELVGAPDGLIASVLSLEGEGLFAQVSMSGDRLSGSGAASIQVDDVEVLTSQASWDNQRLSVSAQSQAEALPIELVQTLLGAEPIELAAEIPLSDAGRPTLTEEAFIRLNTAALAVSLTPAGSDAFEVEIALGRAIPARVIGPALAFDTARSAGRVLLEDTPRFEGEMAVTNLEAAAGLGARLIAGEIGFAWTESGFGFATDLMVSEPTGLPQPVNALAGPTPQISATGQVDIEHTTLLIDQINMALRAGDLSGSGTLDWRERSWTGLLRSEALALERVTEYVSGSGQVLVQGQGGFAGATEALVEFDGYRAASPLARYLEGSVSGSVRLAEVRAGRVDITRASVRAGALRLAATGQLDGDRQMFAGDLVWSGPSPIEPVQLSSDLAATFEVQASSTGLRARFDAVGEGVSASGQALTAPRLRAEISRIDGVFSGQTRLTGTHAQGAIDLAADLSQSGAGLQINSLSGQVGPVDLALGGRLALNEISVGGIVTPRSGRGQLETRLSVLGGDIDGRLFTEGFEVSPEIRLEQSDVTLSGSLTQPRITAALAGTYKRAFSAAMEGRVTRRGEGASFDFDLSGRYGRVGFETLAPARIALDPNPAIDLQLGIEGGELHLRADLNQSASIAARLESLPAALLTAGPGQTPIEGRLDGQVDFRRRDGVWLGQASLTGTDLRQPSDPDDRPIHGMVEVIVSGEDAVARAQADGEDLLARADIRLDTGPITALAQLADPGLALSGELVARGEMGQLAAFGLQDSQTLQGLIDLNASVGGVMADPVLEGALEIRQAQFRDGRIGFDVQDLNAAAAFTRSGASLTSFSASDGQGGRLSASAQVNIANGIDGDASISFDRFHLVSREDIEARASGSVIIGYRDGEGEITGAAVVDRADLTPPETVNAPIAQIEVTEINRPMALNTVSRARAGVDFALNYQLSAPRRVFVRGDNFDTEWGFDLTLSGTSRTPHVAGEAQIVRRRADVLGRAFEVSRGEVLLDGDVDEAQLYVEALNVQPGFTARVSASGKVSDPEIGLSSDPGLPEDEIVSRILFGESAAGLSALQAAQMAGALANLTGVGGGFDPLGQLRDVAGLDMLGVRRNSSGETVLAGGRYLSDDLFLTVESAMGGEGTQSRIDWTLTPRFTLSSSLDAQGRAGVALLWQIEYDDDPFGEMRLFRGFGASEDTRNEE